VATIPFILLYLHQSMIFIIQLAKLLR